MKILIAVLAVVFGLVVVAAEVVFVACNAISATAPTPPVDREMKEK